MKANKELNEELKELSPWLLSMKEQKEGFKVPVDYFENLQEEVLRKVQQPAAESTPVKPGWLEILTERLQVLLQPRYRYAYAFAAVLVLVAVVWVLRTQSVNNSNRNAMAIDNVPSDELIDYIQDHIDEFASDDILDAQKMNSGTLTLPELVPAPGDSEIEDYLDDIMHDIDVEDIEGIL